MKREIAERWITELRSGKYEQGDGYLDYKGKLCCLGVLCYLAVVDGVIPEPDITADGSRSFGIAEDTSRASLPDSVRRWAGIRTEFGDYIDDGTQTALASRNDAEMGGHHVYPFSKIADIIETYVDQL